MSPAKHLPLEKFEAVDMPLRDAITLRPGESCVHSSIISEDAIGKTLEVGDMTLFRSLEPLIECLCPSLSEHAHKFLTQEKDFVEIRTRLTDGLKLLLLGGQLLWLILTFSVPACFARKRAITGHSGRGA
jgi:hypothetical protein